MMKNESEIQEKFDQIKAGKLSPEAFMNWVLKQQSFSYQDGYDQAVWDTTEGIIPAE